VREARTRTGEADATSAASVLSPTVVVAAATLHSTADSPQATAYPPPRLTQDAITATEAAIREANWATADAAGRDAPIEATEMVTYTNPVLGLSFAYPAIMGEVEFEIGPSEEGCWHGTTFARFTGLRLEGRSSNFSAARGGMLGDTRGFARTPDGQYLWLGCCNESGSPFEPEEVIQTAAGEIPLFRPPSSTCRQTTCRASSSRRTLHASPPKPSAPSSSLFGSASRRRLCSSAAPCPFAAGRAPRS
jgi:hypothetical protein